MRKYLAGLAAGLVMFGAFLLVTLPAGFVIPRVLPAHLQQHIKISDLSGSIWNGAAASVQAYRFDLGQGQWQLSPWKLLATHVEGSFALHRHGFSANGDLSSDLQDRLFLENLQGSLLLSDLVATDHFVPGIDGIATFDIETLLFVERKPTSTSGIVNISDLQLAWIPGFDLGDYKLTLSQENQTVRIDITDIRGPMFVNLLLQLTPDSNRYRYDLRGFLQPKTNSDMLLSPALQWLGTPDNSGRYTVQQSGSFSPN